MYSRVSLSSTALIVYSHTTYAALASKCEARTSLAHLSRPYLFAHLLNTRIGPLFITTQATGSFSISLRCERFLIRIVSTAAVQGVKMHQLISKHMPPTRAVSDTCSKSVTPSNRVRSSNRLKCAINASHQLGPSLTLCSP